MKLVEGFIKGYRGYRFDYHRLIKLLETYVSENFELDYERNPVINRMKYLSPSVIREVVMEYSQFSNEAIHMLLDARIRVNSCPDLAREIDRNIREEMGSETNNVPHLEIMRQGYWNAFRFDVNNYEISDDTRAFLWAMRKIFRNNNPAYLAGALLAFETVSIPEFQALGEMVDKCYKNRIMTKNKELDSYIEGHKTFEVGHRQGLIKAIEPYVGPSEMRDFSTGYIAVCQEMSNWWHTLNNLTVRITNARRTV